MWIDMWLKTEHSVIYSYVLTFQWEYLPSKVFVVLLKSLPIWNEIEDWKNKNIARDQYTGTVNAKTVTYENDLSLTLQTRKNLNCQYLYSTVLIFTRPVWIGKKFTWYYSTVVWIILNSLNLYSKFTRPVLKPFFTCPNRYWPIKPHV